MNRKTGGCASLYLVFIVLFILPLTMLTGEEAEPTAGPRHFGVSFWPGINAPLQNGEVIGIGLVGTVGGEYRFPGLPLFAGIDLLYGASPLEGYTDGGANPFAGTISSISGFAKAGVRYPLNFYDKGSYSNGWRYLEAAPASTEWESKTWGGYGTEVGAAAQGTAIGTGAVNTQAIVTAYGANEPDDDRSDYAAKLCDDLDYGGYDDWFLPSKDELNQMNIQKAAIGGFANDYYWSSSELDSIRAWLQPFLSGPQYSYGKNTNARVRAVRAF